MLRTCQSAPTRTHVLLGMLAGFTSFSAPVAAQLPAADGSVSYTADEVKAAFLYHFGTYVRWSGDLDDEITIAVLGAEAIATHLERFLPGRRIEDRPVSVRRIDAVDELGDDVEMLFIGDDDSVAIARAILALDGRPILIVTHANGALQLGSMINLRVVEERVRFEISLGAAQRAGLMLSSRLLAAAVRVERD